MNIKLWCIILLSLFNIFTVLANQVCGSSNALYKVPGDAIILGFFNTHSGPNCSISEFNGLQKVQSSVSAMDTIRFNNFVPGVKIGLAIYETCSNEEMAQKSLISALVDAECQHEFVIGGIADSNIHWQSFDALATNLKLPLTKLTSETTRYPILMVAAASLLKQILWSSINHLIISGTDLDDIFIKAASDRRICIQQTSFIHEINSVHKDSTVVILAQDEDKISRFLSVHSVQKLLIVSYTGNYSITSRVQKESTTLILVPSSLKEDLNFTNPFNSTEEFNQIQPTFELSQSKATLEEIQTLADMLKVVYLFKGHIAQHCSHTQEWSLCSNSSKVEKNATLNVVTQNSDLIRSALKVLRIEVKDFEGFIVLNQKGDELEKFGSLQLLDGHWYLTTEVNITESAFACQQSVNESVSIDCLQCVNYNTMFGDGSTVQYKSPIIGLKEDAWVAALISISTVGVTCCFAIAVFIIVRICKKDVLEGNPGFSFLLLLAILFMYCSMLPYTFKVLSDDPYWSGVMCSLKVFGTTLSYSLVFSIMLARGVMLASCDKEGGFMSHINGYLQTVLCFFIAAVQFALTLQFWAVNWLILSHEQSHEMSSGAMLMYLLVYNMILLGLLACVAPFIVTSKRNYYEGAYFSGATVLSIIIWVSWCSVYMLKPNWHDAAICSGLVATASAILISVFIPRTYLMLTGIVRDHIVSTLPSLAHTATTSVVDINYRSTQALYDSVNPGANYYIERPNTPSTSRVESRGAKSPENTYERYDSPPSPHTITRF